MKLAPNEQRTYEQLQRFLYLTYASGEVDITIAGTKMRTSSGTKYDFAEIHLYKDIKNSRTDIIIANPNAVEIEVFLSQSDINIDGMSYNLQAQQNQQLINAVNNLTNGIATLIESSNATNTKLESLKSKTDTTNANLNTLNGKQDEIKSQIQAVQSKLDTANATLTQIYNKP